MNELTDYSNIVYGIKNKISWFYKGVSEKYKDKYQYVGYEADYLKEHHL